MIDMRGVWGRSPPSKSSQRGAVVWNAGHVASLTDVAEASPDTCPPTDRARGFKFGSGSCLELALPHIRGHARAEASRGAVVIELVASTALLLFLVAGMVEYGRFMLQSISLSMVALEATVFAGSLNLSPGVTVSPAILDRKDALLSLPGQSRLFFPSSVAVESELSRVGTPGLPANSVRVRLSAAAALPLGFGVFTPGGVPLGAAFVGPNYLGAPLRSQGGFQNPSPLVNCSGAPINGCTSSACANSNPC